MKKIIITIPPTKLIIDAMSLSIITAKMIPMATQQINLKQLRESMTISLN